jgi:uncharacterized protein (DUF1778 family)
MRYIQPARTSTVAGRLSRADRRLVEAAAAARETTISAYVAQTVTRAARRDLLDTSTSGGGRETSAGN